MEICFEIVKFGRTLLNAVNKDPDLLKRRALTDDETRVNGDEVKIKA